MPPRTSKPPTTPAPVDDARKTADALWLFEQFLNCDPPVSLNVMPISEKTGVKPNTIVKRINTLQHRYPGFGIVTRTTGAKQSSNVVPATPKLNTDLGVKKSAGKTGGRETRSKKVETVEDDDDEDEEEDKDDTSKKQTKVKKVVTQKRPNKKIRPDQENQTQAAADDEDLDKPSNLPSRKLSKGIKSQNKDTSTQPSSDSDDNTDDAEESDIEQEAPTKKTATPKTRGGRKSAGIGELKDLRTDPEKIVPRGRHAIPKKTSAPAAEIVKDVLDVSDVKDANDDDNAVDHPSGSKRKRSASPKPQSSPLTPSPAVKQRLDKMETVEQSEKDGSGADLLGSSDIPLPSKKQKTNHIPTEGDSIETEVIVEKRSSSDIPEAEEAPPVVTARQENTSAKVEKPAADLAETSDEGPRSSAGLEQDLNKSITTPLGQNIDDIPSPSDEADDDDNECAAENDQFIENPTSPTAGRGQLTKPAPEASSKTTAVSTFNNTADGSPTITLKKTREVELPPNAVERHVEETSSAKTFVKSQPFTTIKPHIKAMGARLMGTETPHPSRSSKVRQPTEWTLYHPTPKPSKPE